MDIRNIDSRLQHLRHGPQLPPGPDWSDAVRNRPSVPAEAPAQAAPKADPTLVSPHAPPAERQIVLSQQSISEALRELKLPATPQNAMIAQALAQMDQPVSAQNMSLVREALRGMAMANADDIAAAVVLLMHDLPVTPAGVAAVRQLMNGPALPDQLARLGSQVTRLIGQLDQTGQQLAALGFQGPVPGQPPAAPPHGTVPGMPLNVVPPAVQAAAAQTQAAQAQAAAGMSEASGDSGGAFTVADSDEGQGPGEGQEAGGTTKGSGAGAAGGMAGLTGTGNRRENAPISRALGGAIGRMTSDQTEGVGQPLPDAPMPMADTAPGEASRPSGRDGSSGQQGGSKRGQQAASDQQGATGQAGDPGDTADVTLEQFAAKATGASAKLHVGPGRPAMADAPLPPGLTSGTAPGAAGQSGTGATGAQAAAGSSTSAGTTGAAAGGQTQAGTSGQAQVAVASGRLHVGALGDAARAPGDPTRPQTMAPGGTGTAPVPGGGVGDKLGPAAQLLRSAELATTVREPAYLPQQVAALKTVFRELPAALLSVAKELHEFAADPRPVADIPLPELESLLAKAVGHRAGVSLDAQDEGLLRQLFDDLRQAMAATSGSLTETLGNLHAREQLTQSTNVMCLPLALPGPPPRPVELLVEADPDEEHRRRQGGSPTQMRLSIDTHHLGRVGIDLVSWQEKLSITLQVSNPKIQALVADKLAELDKALARSGFVTPDLRVAVAPAEQRASMLLPERKYMRSLRRIEGIV